MRGPRASLLAVLVLPTFACGGLTVDEPTANEGNVVAPTASTSSARALPTPVFVADSSSCSTGTLPSAEEALASGDKGKTEQFDIAEIRYVDECTGLGGTWIVGRGRGFTSPNYFLGEHGCALWQSPPLGRFAIVRYAQTAAWFRLNEGACISFDGLESSGFDRSTRAMVVFETRGEAELYAALRNIHIGF